MRIVYFGCPALPIFQKIQRSICTVQIIYSLMIRYVMAQAEESVSRQDAFFSQLLLLLLLFILWCLVLYIHIF